MSIRGKIKEDFVLKNIHEGYLVGGYVRDFLMDKQNSADRDIAVKDAEKFAKKLAKEFDATFITLDDENKIYRLVLRDKINYLDISELRGNSIEEDLKERDFTINAIAYDLSQDKFVDVTGGIEDIKNKKIRGIKEENFTDDPLRILRAYRFMAVTGFETEETLSPLLVKYLPLLDKPAKERVHDEIMKLFGGDYTSKTLLKMLEDGILEVIFPCVKDMKKIPSNSHHHLDLIHHVIETVRQVEILYKNADEQIKLHLNQKDFGGYPRINHLKLASFLHDVGKPSTWTIEENGRRHRFIKHDIKGAEIVAPILKDLKFSNKQIEYIAEMIRKHIYPSSVISAPVVENKIMMRYVRKMEDNVIDNIILAKADRLSAKGPDITNEIIEENIKGLDKLLKFYMDVKNSLEPLPKILNGNQIMEILNIKPSPILGKILNHLHEAQINGDVSTKEEAEEFVKKIYLL